MSCNKEPTGLFNVEHMSPDKRFEEQRPEGVTLAICTYNGAARLAPTLAKAAAQIHANVPFEVLLIDNASTDCTAEAARALWPTELSSRLRIFHEAAPGVANARLRALREATYSILSFVDDDNWISANWVAETYRIFESHPKVALVHCCSRARLQGPKPEDFSIYAGWLAVGSLFENEGVIERRPVSFWTAGLSVRIGALGFLDDPAFALALTGRTAGETLGGEDHEICLCILLGGWEAYATKSIFFVHDIPVKRLEQKYIERLVENGGRSRRILNEYRSQFSSEYYPTGFYLLASYLIEFFCRYAVYEIKRITGRLESGISPSALSYYIARGKLVGYFSTARRVSIARRNIAIAKRYHGPELTDQDS